MNPEYYAERKKEARHEETNITCSHFHAVSKVGQFIETESR